MLILTKTTKLTPKRHLTYRVVFVLREHLYRDGLRLVLQFVQIERAEDHGGKGVKYIGFVS